MSASDKRRRKRLKEKFWLIQQGKCWLCGGQMVKGGNGPMSATWDHYIPQSRGGTDRQDNLMLAHGRCNSLRGNRQECVTINPYEHERRTA